VSVERRLQSLDNAMAAASALGLDVSAAEKTRDTMHARLGFPSSAYVLALAGGTGVGKSTLLNALAGDEVSATGARRPTTSEAIAWVPSNRRHELRGLLGWLGITTVREHAGGGLGDVAVLDLPDFDSIAVEHRERVDGLLPRVDSVAWVVDPEKYMDQVMHSGYLRRYAPRMRHQIVVLNRSDLLAPEDAQRVAVDMRDRLRRDGAGDMVVVLTCARDGAGGVTALREWLESAAEAKRVVVSRIEAEAREVVRGLAAEAGVVDGTAGPLVERSRRDRALNSVVRATLALIDIAGLERQAVAATRFAARRRGAGPLRHVTSAFYRLVGRDRVAADPARYLSRWRLRGSLAPAVEPLRELVTSTLPGVPAPLRRKLAALTVPASLDARLAETIDRALTAEAADFRVPTSGLWSIIGAGQYVVTAVLIFSLLWFASLFVVHDVPTGTILVPFLGPVPTPVALLAASLLAGYVFVKLLQLHAGWLGRRWAKQVGSHVTAEVTQRMTDELLVPLDEFDASRAALGMAAREG
jgi:GTP-binding protein EngB required for normal cell division